MFFKKFHSLKFHSNLVRLDVMGVNIGDEACRLMRLGWPKTEEKRTSLEIGGKGHKNFTRH
jgi:hypothetical protein